MLKKILHINFKIALALLVGLILIQLITAYAFGFVIESQFQKQFDYFAKNNPFIHVDKREYHRGLFSSDITTQISLNNHSISNIIKLLPNSAQESANQLNINNNYSIKYVTHINQGLFAGALSGNFVPKMAYAITTIEYPESLANTLNNFFDNQQPLKIYDTLYLNKSGDLHFVSPSFDYKEAVSGVQVTWGGLNANISYNKSFDHFNSNIGIPNFALTAPTKGSFLLKGLSYKEQSSLSKNNIKVGNTSLDLQKISIEWTDKIAFNFKIGDILHMITGISSTQFLNTIDVINPNNFTFSNIMYSSTSHDDNDLFGANAHVTFESLITNGNHYGPFNLDVSLDHIYSPQFNKLADTLSKFAANNDESQEQQLITLLKDNFGPILINSPVLNLNRLELVTPNGLIKLTGYATTHNFTQEDMNNQDDFLKKLNLEFSYSIPKPIISYLFLLQMKYLLTAGNAELDNQSSEALTKVINILLDNQISTWTKKGYIKNTNGILSSHIEMKDGVMIINGVKTK